MIHKDIFMTAFFSSAVLLGAISASGTQVAPAEITAADRVEEIRDSLKTILKEAQNGDAEAMNEVGTWYYSGKHVNQDYSQAYEWWKKASLKANVRAIANLGLCYQLGRGVEPDSVDAIRLYKKSIKEGNKSLFEQRAANATNSAFDAMLTGECYEEGVGVKRDLRKAATNYALAADKGSIEGLRRAGLSYLNAKDYGKAYSFFRKGASKGDTSSLYWAGKMLLGNMQVPADPQQASVYLLKAAEEGMPAAQTEVGLLYAEGDVVSKDYTKSAEWLRKSALQRFPKGMWNYAMTLKDGKGTQQNYDDALYWMSEAASAGYKRTFKNLVSQLDSVGKDPFTNYIKGMKIFLTEKNFKDASVQFKKVEKAKIDDGRIMQAVILADLSNEKRNVKKAIKQLTSLSSKNPEAAYQLGVIYETGDENYQDLTQAINYYRQASELGNAKALCRLADLYYEGRGLEKNHIKAMSLYLRAEELGRLTQNGAARLAEYFENGGAGLPQDRKRAANLRKSNRESSLNSILEELNL